MKSFIHKYYSPFMLAVFAAFLAVTFAGLSVIFNVNDYAANRRDVSQAPEEHFFESADIAPPPYERSRVLGVATDNGVAPAQPSNGASVPPVTSDEREREDAVTVSITVQSPESVDTFSVSLRGEHPTVYDAMIAADEAGLVSVAMESFGDLGYLVTEINGLASGDGFWVYDINGAFATKGISEQKISDNDTITWKYE